MDNPLDTEEKFTNCLNKAESGDAECQFLLGRCYYFGFWVEQDNKKAFEWYKRAAEQDYPKAQVTLGVMYENGQGVEKDYLKAIEWYRRAAEQGDAYSQSRLGDFFKDGQDVEKDYHKAFEWYKRAAEQGDAYSQSRLGDFFKDGQGVEQDYSRAFSWYLKAAEHGYQFAQYEIGECYANGTGTEISQEKSLKWYRKAASQGLASFQFLLGSKLLLGEEVKQDYKEAYKWLLKAAEQDYASAQWLIGQMYENGNGVDRNYSKAATWYSKAAAKNDEAALCSLGLLYIKGKELPQDFSKALEFFTKSVNLGYASGANCLGVLYDESSWKKHDHQKAIEWYRRAAEQNDPEAQFNLGVMYENGRGVEKDCLKAIEWYRRAAEQDCPEAQLNLGGMYYNGQGMEKDHHKAFEWYRRAAEQDYPQAQFNLGAMYDNGQGVEKDFLKAFEWYRRAAEQNDPEAQLNLGVMYDNGQGVEKDYKKAFEWYKQAAILGNPIAQCMLGKCYKYGYGIEINEETALSWFFKAYEQEEPDSLFLIADSYISSGPMQDQRKAVEWSEKNYSKDNLLSAITLGYCYDAFCLKEKLLSCAQAWLDNINLRWLGNLILADMYQSGEAGNAIDSVKAYEYCRLAIEDFNLEPEESFTYEFAKLLIDEASSHMRNLHNDDINSKLTEVDYKAAQMDVLRRVEPSSALFKVIKSFPLILKKTLNKMSTKSDLLIGQDPVETAIWKNLMEWNSDRAKFQTFCVNKAKLEGVHYDYSSSSDYSRKREASIILRKAESIGTLDIESDKGLSEIIDAAYPRASDKRKNRIFNDVRSRQAGRMFSLEAQMQDSSNTVSDSVENNLFHSTSDISVFRSTEEEVFQQEGTLNMVENLLSDLDKAYPARSDFNKAMYSCIVFIILINGTDLPVEQIERFLSETKHFNANIEGIKKYVLSTMRHGSIIEQAKVCEMLEVHQSQYSRARNDLVSKISNSIAKNKEDI